MSEVNEAQFMEITRKVMSDTRPQQLEIDVKSMWLLVSALQLVVKHPGLSALMKQALTRIARQFQNGVTGIHPEAETPMQMGWNSAYDVNDKGEPAPQVLHHAWEIYPDEKDMNTFFGRPQDWGDKSKWLYVPVVFEAMGYENHVHLWVNKPEMKPHEVIRMAAGLITTMMQPGEDAEICGNEFLAQDDFWQEAWGEMPPHFEPDEED